MAEDLIGLTVVSTEFEDGELIRALHPVDIDRTGPSRLSQPTERPSVRSLTSACSTDVRTVSTP